MPVGDQQALITQIVSRVLNEPAQTDKTFPWFINKHTEEHFGHRYPIIHQVFSLLKGDHSENQGKRSMPLKCDAYFGGTYNFIFEFDEFQHFSSARLSTFDCYEEDFRFNFDVTAWKKYCSTHRARADQYRKAKVTKDFTFAGGRTAQRAYLDCFRDLLPGVQGLQPTLRINEFEVASISSANKESCQRVEQLLKEKLRYM